MNKTLSALLLSGILGAMALPALADTESSGGNSTGTTMPTPSDDTKPMPPADDEDGIPPVQGPNTEGNPGGQGAGSGNGTGGNGSGSGSSGSGSGSGTGN